MGTPETGQCSWWPRDWAIGTYLYGSSSRGSFASLVCTVLRAYLSWPSLVLTAIRKRFRPRPARRSYRRRRRRRFRCSRRRRRHHGRRSDVHPFIVHLRRTAVMFGTPRRDGRPTRFGRSRGGTGTATTATKTTLTPPRRRTSAPVSIDSDFVFRFRNAKTVVTPTSTFCRQITRVRCIYYIHIDYRRTSAIGRYFACILYKYMYVRVYIINIWDQ